MTLDPVEVRVIGALAEKALATPDYYPMSLNALVAACNQKTGRDPVMDLAEPDAARALDSLTRKGLAGTTSGAGSRVAKYRHLLDHQFELDTPEVAALAVLMLRGPQTVGEVKGRTGRLYTFESLEEAEATVRRLAERDEPLVVELPVQPGRKEPRFAHLLGGMPEVEATEHVAAESPAMRAARAEGDRVVAGGARRAVGGRARRPPRRVRALPAAVRVGSRRR
jgi:uncharacterized protein